MGPYHRAPFPTTDGLPSRGLLVPLQGPSIPICRLRGRSGRTAGPPPRSCHCSGDAHSSGLAAAFIPLTVRRGLVRESSGVLRPLPLPRSWWKKRRLTSCTRRCRGRAGASDHRRLICALPRSWSVWTMIRLESLCGFSHVAPTLPPACRPGWGSVLPEGACTRRVCPELKLCCLPVVDAAVAGVIAVFVCCSRSPASRARREVYSRPSWGF